MTSFRPSVYPLIVLSFYLFYPSYLTFHLSFCSAVCHSVRLPIYGFVLLSVHSLFCPCGYSFCLFGPSIIQSTVCVFAINFIPAIRLSTYRSPLLRFHRPSIILSGWVSVPSFCPSSCYSARLLFVCLSIRHPVMPSINAEINLKKAKRVCVCLLSLPSVWSST